jgi:LuxR family maltose regulon positive regulatory protein
LVGDAGEADRWTASAERTSATGELPDGNTIDGSVAYLRALLCRRGPEEMRVDAERALKGLSPTSPYRPAMLHAIGMADLLRGDHDAAEASFVLAQLEATSAHVLPFVPVLLAERGIIAIERDDWHRAGMLAEEALALMDGGLFDDYWTSALVYAWAARTAVARGSVAQARELTRSATRLRPLLNHVLPIVSVQTLLELARAYLALADAGGASAVLGQVREIRRLRPQLGVLTSQAEDLTARLAVLEGGTPGVTSLTTAELRLVPLLPTHLSFAEIGERLYVSRHTVKTQALSIYRKIGVSSRSEAVARLVDLGVRAPA